MSKSGGANVAEYLKKLSDRTKPLQALEKAKAVLRLSVEALDGETRGRWAALGLFEGGFDADAAASVWAVEEAGGTLEELEQRSLVSFDPQARRYHLHDLLRAVALEEFNPYNRENYEIIERGRLYFRRNLTPGSMFTGDFVNLRFMLDLEAGLLEQDVNESEGNGRGNNDFTIRLARLRRDLAAICMVLAECCVDRDKKGWASECWRQALVLYRKEGLSADVENVERLLREAGVDPDRDEAAE